MRRRDAITLVILAVLAAVAVVLRLYAVGPTLAPEISNEAREQIMMLRTLRVGAGACVGVCLAVAGVMLQSLMRNPLASPDLMGMSAGAGLAVLLARAAGWTSALGGASALSASGFSAAWEVLPALVGSIATLALVFSLSQRRGLVDPTWLVLIGVMVGVLAGAGIMLVQHLFPSVSAGGNLRVLVGALSDEITRSHVIIAGATAIVGIAIGLALGPAMDAGAMDPDEAMSVGVPLRRVRAGLLLAAGVLTAAAVALAGPLGFVGLVCPHAARLLASRGRTASNRNTSAAPLEAAGWWGMHRVRLIGSALAGIALIVGGDAVVSAIRSANESVGRIPLGVVMAFIGAPAFVLLLRRGVTIQRGMDD